MGEGERSQGMTLASARRGSVGRRDVVVGFLAFFDRHPLCGTAPFPPSATTAQGMTGSLRSTGISASRPSANAAGGATTGDRGRGRPDAWRPISARCRPALRRSIVRASRPGARSPLRRRARRRPRKSARLSPSLRPPRPRPDRAAVKRLQPRSPRGDGARFGQGRGGRRGVPQAEMHTLERLRQGLDEAAATVIFLRSCCAPDRRPVSVLRMRRWLPARACRRRCRPRKWSW